MLEVRRTVHDQVFDVFPEDAFADERETFDACQRKEGTQLRPGDVERIEMHSGEEWIVSGERDGRVDDEMTNRGEMKQRG